MKLALFGIQRRLRSIMAVQDSAKRESALRDLATQLGCSLASTYLAPSGKHLEEEVIRRIQEAAREERDSRMWWIAVISALAALFSAIAACVAVLKAS
jgi:hypothetical protein